MKIDAHHIVRLLAAKHAEDVFIPECKDGPSAGTTHFRLDWWAMQKSWSRPTTYGYEVKVSRNDFVRDDKWQNYLELCSDFYFVCPDGLIKPEEVPGAAGLLWVAKTGTRLWLKKKAQRREVQIPETMWRYIVMRLDTENSPALNRESFWRDWLAAKEQSLDLGHRVSHRLAAVVHDQIDKVKCRNLELERENAKWADFKRFADALGISVHSWNLQEHIREKADLRRSFLTSNEVHQMEMAHRALGAVLKSFSEEAKP